MSEEKISKLWTMYENGRAYQKELGITEQIPQNVDFFEGRQWGDTSRLQYTRDYPRPVLNMVKMICRNKKAAVLAAPVKLVFRGSSRDESGQELTRFLEYVQKELHQADLDNEAIDDAVKKGSYFYHYYWDAEAQGVAGSYEGGVRAELIDPLDIFFSDPQERDIQKQKWVLIASREELSSVRAMAEPGVAKELIRPDDAERRYGDEHEQSGSELVTVLTRYFRKDGEVCFERGTRCVMLHAPRALDPQSGERTKGGEDAPEDGLPDEAEAGEDIDRPRATLYPIACGVWEKREKSVYGLSEVEDLIPNQKAINRAAAVKLLIGQAQSSSKIVVKEGALGSQQITNSPLQVLTDHGKQQAQSFYTLPPGQVSPILRDMDTQLLADTRTVSGSTEVLSGEVISANMSGAAIAALQAQAQKPIDELQRRFFRTREATGEILVQFAKLFYEDKAYSYYDDRAGRLQQDVFDGRRYRNEAFEVVCEAGAGSVYSDSMLVNILSGLLEKQIIDAKTYIDRFPATLLPNKTELLTALEQQEQGQAAQLKQQLQQARQQLEKAVQVIRQQQSVVEKVASVIQESRRKDELLASLQAEYTGKIRQANAEIERNYDLAEKVAAQALKVTEIGGGDRDNGVPEVR